MEHCWFCLLPAALSCESIVHPTPKHAYTFKQRDADVAEKDLPLHESTHAKKWMDGERKKDLLVENMPSFFKDDGGN